MEPASRKGLILFSQIDERVPTLLRGDPYRLQQIVSNLLSNAIKFTERGEIVIEVISYNVDLQTCDLLFVVRDTGIGMTPELCARLFQPFTQADGSMTRKYGGSGLGLAIAKQLTELMGGAMGVESAVGQGTTFWFTLRCTSAVLSETQVGTLAPSSPLVAQCAGRILVVEDNPVNQEVAQALLEDLGCEVDTAANGQEAIEALERAPYDLVFMDCQMPKMDGFVATRAIRAREATAPAASPLHLPIIALTAHALVESCEQCLAAGMDDHLSKPFTQEELATRLRRWLPRSVNAQPNSGTDGVVTSKIERPTPSPDVLDSRALAAIRLLQRPGNPDLLQKVISSYLTTAPQFFVTMRDAVKRGDGAGVQMAAHSLKSSSANLGATALATFCKELEELGRTNALEKASALLAQAEASYASVQEVLTRECHTGAC
jgi:CheY-like chemotaxis protein/HPt (histidine-containing phosphotransfer) domain-containing protein